MILRTFAPEFKSYGKNIRDYESLLSRLEIIGPEKARI